MIIASRTTHPHEQLAIGIDVGGTKAATVITDGEDRLLMHDVVATEPDRLAEQVVALAREARQQLGGESRTVAAVGVAVAGHVDSDTGTLGLAVNLGLPSVALRDVVEEALGLPCAIEHDARAAARWLHHTGGGASANLAYLSVGTGISAGIVTGGQPLRGANGLAGEIGHVVAEPGGARCGCGLDGCLEAVAAGPAVARLARDAVAAGRESSLPPDATAAQVFRAAADGDALASEIVGSAAAHLGRAVRGLVLAFGVDRVVVGGGVAGAGDALMEPLLAAIRDERRMSPLVETAFAPVTIELLPPHIEAGARGAAEIARQRVNAQQREEVGDT